MNKSEVENTAEKKPGARKGGKGSLIIGILILLVGLSLLLYPTISGQWNAKHQSRAIATYNETVENLDEQQTEKLWNDAVEYNKRLKQSGYVHSEEKKSLYPKMLSPDSTGIMGSVIIPSINVMLPIYHGTEASVLQVGVGHIDWSSLPTGGASTHCIVSGHTGLPSAMIFTRLDRVKIGDVFMMEVLGRTLTYQVEQIQVVLPEETQSLVIEEGRDLCTLITCTPYGVNSHRLLVTGHRIENIEITSDAIPVEEYMVAPFVALPLILLAIAVYLLVSGRRKNKSEKGDKDEESV